MKDKKIVWAFSGVGKSSVNTDKYVIVDADSKMFQFGNVEKNNLHSSKPHECSYNTEFPENYINYVKQIDANIVLINCNVSLISAFDDVLLVYPDKALKSEYLSRYKQRGDNASYISYMEDNFDDIINCLERLNYPKLKICNENVFLNDLLKGEKRYMFMTKSNLTELLQKGFDLKEMKEYRILNLKNLDRYFAHGESDMAAMAQDIFEGKIEMNLDEFKRDFNDTEQKISNEIEASKRRLGLSRDELADKIMQGIVNGALGIRYAEISPYSHGYEVTFGENTPAGSTRNFINRWECYCDFFEVGKKVADDIGAGRQSNRVYGQSCQPLELSKLLKAIDDKEANKLTGFTPEADTDFRRWKGYDRGSVASVMDVHAGKGLDGIVKHHYHGDYSTITPVNQNRLVETLCFMKGMCLDCLKELDMGPAGKQNVIDYLKKHGTDISTPEKLAEWIKNNPEKCALDDNRVVNKSLDENEIDPNYDYYFFDEEQGTVKVFYLNDDASSVCLEELAFDEALVEQIDFTKEDFIDEIYEKARSFGIYETDNQEEFNDVKKSIENGEYTLKIPSDGSLNSILKEKLMNFAGKKRSAINTIDEQIEAAKEGRDIEKNVLDDSSLER